MTISPDKEKALETAMSQVERQFGKGSIMKLGSRPVIDVPVISTSSLALDKALGIGGLPRGRVIEIYGPRHPEKPHLPCMRLLKPRNRTGSRPSLMQSMRLTRCMPKSWASIVMTFWSRNPIPVSRHLRSQTCWSEAVRLISW